MIKPKRWQPGDKVALVSLSSGMLGEDFARHELEIGLRRLEAYGLRVKFARHALMGLDYVKTTRRTGRRICWKPLPTRKRT